MNHSGVAVWRRSPCNFIAAAAVVAPPSVSQGPDHILDSLRRKNSLLSCFQQGTQRRRRCSPWLARLVVLATLCQTHSRQTELSVGGA